MISALNKGHLAKVQRKNTILAAASALSGRLCYDRSISRDAVECTVFSTDLEAAALMREAWRRLGEENNTIQGFCDKKRNISMQKKAGSRRKKTALALYRLQKLLKTKYEGQDFAAQVASKDF